MEKEVNVKLWPFTKSEQSARKKISNKSKALFGNALQAKTVQPAENPEEETTLMVEETPDYQPQDVSVALDEPMPQASAPVSTLPVHGGTPDTPIMALEHMFDTPSTATVPTAYSLDTVLSDKPTMASTASPVDAMTPVLEQADTIPVSDPENPVDEPTSVSAESAESLVSCAQPLEGDASGDNILNAAEVWPLEPPQEPTDLPGLMEAHSLEFVSKTPDTQADSIGDNFAGEPGPTPEIPALNLTEPESVSSSPEAPPTPQEGVSYVVHNLFSTHSYVGTFDDLEMTEGLTASTGHATVQPLVASYPAPVQLTSQSMSGTIPEAMPDPFPEPSLMADAQVEGPDSLSPSLLDPVLEKLDELGATPPMDSLMNVPPTDTVPFDAVSSDPLLPVVEADSEPPAKTPDPVLDSVSESWEPASPDRAVAESGMSESDMSDYSVPEADEMSLTLTTRLTPPENDAFEQDLLFGAVMDESPMAEHLDLSQPEGDALADFFSQYPESHEPSHEEEELRAQTVVPSELESFQPLTEPSPTEAFLDSLPSELPDAISPIWEEEETVTSAVESPTRMLGESPMLEESQSTDLMAPPGLFDEPAAEESLGPDDQADYWATEAEGLEDEDLVNASSDVDLSDFEGFDEDAYVFELGEEPPSKPSTPLQKPELRLVDPTSTMTPPEEVSSTLETSSEGLSEASLESSESSFESSLGSMDEALETPSLEISEMASPDGMSLDAHLEYALEPPDLTLGLTDAFAYESDMPEVAMESGLWAPDNVPEQLPEAMRAEETLPQEPVLEADNVSLNYPVEKTEDENQANEQNTLASESANWDPEPEAAFYTAYSETAYQRPGEALDVHEFVGQGPEPKEGNLSDLVTVEGLEYATAAEAQTNPAMEVAVKPSVEPEFQAEPQMVELPAELSMEQPAPSTLAPVNPELNPAPNNPAPSIAASLKSFEANVILEESRFMKRSIDHLVNQYFSQQSKEADNTH